MARLAIAIAMIAGLLATPASANGPLPPTLRSASVTQQQWDTLQTAVRTTAARANVSERALAAVAERLGVALAEGGRRVDVGDIVGQLDALATRISDLEGRLTTLARDDDAAISALITRARTAINDGDLNGADIALADARRARADRNAQRRAQLEAGLLEEAAIVATQGEVAALRADYLGAAAFYAEAAELAPEGARERWQYREQQASALYQRGVRFDAERLREAVRTYEDLVLPLVPRDAHPDDWARTQGNLAIVHTAIGDRGDRQALNRAIAALEATLTVWTRESSPENWAKTQSNLALAYHALGVQGLPGALDHAFAAHEAALSVVTREANPLRWAGLQNNLGLSLMQAGEAERAVAVYEAVLTVFTREAYPDGWLIAQTNLGLALQDVGVRGAPDALERAVGIYEAVLTATTRDADPILWGTVQFNLGNALNVRGQMGSPGSLERAVTSYERALTSLTREDHPRRWSDIQANLGTALQILGERGVPGAMARAAAAYEAALTVRTREADPADWADTSYNLAFTYAALVRFADARSVAQGALEVFEQIGDAESAAHMRRFLAETPER